MQHPYRLRRDLGAQQRGHSTAHHPIELAAHRRRDPDDQAGPPTRRHQYFGLLIEIGQARGLGYEHQAGARTAGRVGNPRYAVDARVAGCSGVDRGQVDHRVGFVGQLLQDGVGQGRANKLHVWVQARVRTFGNAANRVSGRDQLPCDHPPDRADGVGNQDVHLDPPPPRPPSTIGRQSVCATAALWPGVMLRRATAASRCRPV